MTAVLRRLFWDPVSRFWWISGLNGAGRAARWRLSLKRVAEQYAGRAHVVKLNVDENPSVVEKFRIEAIPTLIVFQNGEEKDRIIGAAGQEAIARAIEARMSSAVN